MKRRNKDRTSELETDENQPDRKALAAFVVASVDLERREGCSTVSTPGWWGYRTNCAMR
ncbi:MAG: hypothetical protein LC781_01720 [Actinobacteria bacterium]|nr:hypothetical protein [Actinomycetota bacterium]